MPGFLVERELEAYGDMFAAEMASFFDVRGREDRVRAFAVPVRQIKSGEI